MVGHEYYRRPCRARWETSCYENVRLSASRQFSVHQTKQILGLHCTGWTKTGQFLRVDNIVTVSVKKVRDMSKVSKFCLEKKHKTWTLVKLNTLCVVCINNQCIWNYAEYDIAWIWTKLSDNKPWKLIFAVAACWVYMIISLTRSSRHGTHFIAVQIVIRRRHSHVSFWMCRVWTKTN